jgi:hypothetical protein
MSTNDAHERGSLRDERARDSAPEMDRDDEINPGDPGPPLPPPSSRPDDPRCDPKLPPEKKPPPGV